MIDMNPYQLLLDTALQPDGSPDDAIVAAAFGPGLESFLYELVAKGIFTHANYITRNRELVAPGDFESRFTADFSEEYLVSFNTAEIQAPMLLNLKVRERRYDAPIDASLGSLVKVFCNQDDLLSFSHSVSGLFIPVLVSKAAAPNMPEVKRYITSLFDELNLSYIDVLKSPSYFTVPVDPELCSMLCLTMNERDNVHNFASYFAGGSSTQRLVYVVSCYKHIFYSNGLLSAMSRLSKTEHDLMQRARSVRGGCSARGYYAY
jgi:hypothetical protein